MVKRSRKQNPIFHFWQILWAFSFSTGVLALIVSFFSLNTGLTGMTPPMTYALTVFFAAVALPIYTLPSYFAYRKGMKGERKLLIWNLLLGWTVVGYVVCIFRVTRVEPVTPDK